MSGAARRSAASATASVALLLGATAPTTAEEVTLYHDPYGVAHVVADTDEALYYGWGYAQARDALLELQVAYATAMGRLAAALGAGEEGAYVESDLEARVHRIPQRAAEAALLLDADVARRLDHFVSGVNRYMEDHPGERAPWFRDVTRTDVLGWLEYMGTLQEISSIRGDFDRAVMYAITEPVSPGAFHALHPVHPNAPATLDGVVSAGGGAGRADAAGVIPAAPGPDRLDPRQADALLRLSGRERWSPRAPWGGVPAFSNAWAVAASRAEGGEPVVAADPHTSLDGPERLWEISLQGESVHAAGFGRRGAPTLFIGHTGTFAWGATNSAPDNADVYMELLDGSRTRYRRSGRGFVPIEVDTVRIAVRDARPVLRLVRSTHHGPILVEAGPFAFAARLASRHESPYGRIAEQIDAMVRAPGITEFRDALAMLQLPRLNFLLADVEDRIYYLHSGRVPVRSHVFDTSLPVPGWLEATEWLGIHGIDELVQAWDPASGVIQTCNALATGDLVGLPPYYPARRHQVDLARPAVAAGVLGALDTVSLADHMTLQNDRTNTMAAWLVPAMLDSVRAAGTPGPLLGAAISVLESWDTVADADAEGQLLYRMWMEDVVEVMLWDQFPGVVPLTSEWLVLDLFRPDHVHADPPETVEALRAFVDHVGTPATETVPDLAAESLRTAARELLTVWGRLAVPWGEVQRIVRGDRDEPIGGGDRWETMDVHRGPIVGLPPEIRVDGGTSARMIVSVGERVRMHCVLAFGQSDDPTSPHFDDQMDLYLSGGYRTPPFYEDEVRAAAVDSLTLSF